MPQIQTIQERIDELLFNYNGGSIDANELKETLKELVYVPSDTVNDGLISGGIVTWSGTGLIFDISSAVYRLGGVIYTTPDSSKTLSLSDTVDARIDVIGLDATGVIVLEGDLSSAPITPQINPETQIFLTSILINANVTVPDAQIYTIYNEHTIDEWTVTSNSISINADDTTNPYSGTKDIIVNSVTSSGSIIFTTDAPQIVTQDATLKLFINYIKEYTGKLRITFYLGTKAVTATGTLGKAGGFGADPNIIGTYQNVSVPLWIFNFYANSFDKIKIDFVGTETTPVVYLDKIELQKGVANTPTFEDFSNKVDSVKWEDNKLYYYIKGQRFDTGLVMTGGGGSLTIYGEFPDNAAALAGGVPVGQPYRLPYLEGFYPIAVAVDSSEVPAAFMQTENGEPIVTDGSNLYMVPESGNTIKISEMTVLSVLDGTEIATVVKNGVNYGVAVSNLKDVNTTIQGNIFNGENQLVKLDSNKSLAIGIGSSASGGTSVAIGAGAVASGTFSTVFGSGSAIGYSSFAIGVNTRAEGYGALALGKFNVSGNTDSLLVIGNGTGAFGRSDLIRFNTNEIIANKPITATAFIGDGSGLTGLPSGGVTIDDTTPSTTKVYSSQKATNTFQPKITVGTIPPANPVLNQLWVDTN